MMGKQSKQYTRAPKAGIGGVSLENVQIPGKKPSPKAIVSKPRIMTHSRKHGFARDSQHKTKHFTRAPKARAEKFEVLACEKCKMSGKNVPRRQYFH